MDNNETITCSNTRKTYRPKLEVVITSQFLLEVRGPAEKW